ncbi:MAG: DUF1989 domain-containing protein [Alphaproteobacteria bacterium]
MKLDVAEHEAPADADARKKVNPVICYPPETLPKPDIGSLRDLRQSSTQVSSIEVPPRDASCIAVPKHCFFTITSVGGPQVGDLNLWNAQDVTERFYAGKTRALHGTHLSTGDRMWSSFPNMRPMATITDDTLDWYGFDDFGGSVHDVIGTRCDPYTGRLLSGSDYHYCCHSNLTRALADYLDIPRSEAEPHVHDVLNVFMCTGFTRDTGQYFMKATPVRPGDYLEFHAEIDLIVGLSACPGGDCSTEHSSDTAACYPLRIDIYDPGEDVRSGYVEPPRSAYDRSHG